MLAWVHQATAGENEFLDGLFDVDKGKRRMVGQAREFGNANSDLVREGVEVDPEEVEQQARVALSRSCLDKNLEGLSRPLKVSQSAVFRSRRYPLTGDAISRAQIRIQDTVNSQEGVIMAYKIANLVQFYLVTMQRTIGEEAILTVTLAE